MDPEAINDQTAGDGSEVDQNPNGSDPQADGQDGNAVGDQPESQTPKWMGQLPSDLKGDENLTQFSTIGELGKAYLDLQGKSERAVEVPGEDATEEQWAAYREKMGIPDKPDNYEFEEVELPNGSSEETEMDQWFRKVAHENGFTQKQANEFRKAWVQQNIEQMKAQQEQFDKAREDAEAKLREEYGERFDETIKLAHEGVKQRSPEFAKFLTDSGLTNHPEMVKLMADIGQLYAEDKMPGGRAIGKAERPTDPRAVEAWTFENTPGMQ